MNHFDIVAAFEDRQWLEDMENRLDAKMRYAVGKARETPWIPYTTDGHQWKKNDIGWWTNGFWPANMWQMYRMTGDKLYREEALRTYGLNPDFNKY